MWSNFMQNCSNSTYDRRYSADTLNSCTSTHGSLNLNHISHVSSSFLSEIKKISFSATNCLRRDVSDSNENQEPSQV
jgi:hypothetical protein